MSGTLAIAVGMYIATILNRGSPPAILLREGYREGGKVRTRTLANLSKLPPEELAALRKAHFKTLADGSEVHSFHTLLKLLSGIVRNVCRVPGAPPDAPTFDVVTTPSAKQQRAYQLLETIEV